MTVITELQYRPSRTMSDAEYASIPAHHVTVWRHEDGTYSLQKTGAVRYRNLDPLMAQSILHHLLGCSTVPVRPLQKLGEGEEPRQPRHAAN
jgi:hypothetical protein